MNLSIVALVVIGQIFVFQFAAVAFVRSLFAAVLGPPEPAGGESAAYLRKTARQRFTLGGVLLLIALAALLGLPGDDTMRKLILTAVSLTSSGAFAYAVVNDRRAVRSIRDTLPESGVRRASLEPRAVSHFYPVAWEFLPVAILLATIVLTIVIGRRLGQITAEMWVLQILQAAFVIGALVYTVRRGLAVPNVSSRLAMLRDRPQLALQFGQRLAAQEMQYFMMAKIGVALLLGISVTEAGMEAVDPAVAEVLGAATWVIVGVLLVLFASFVCQIALLTRRMQNESRQNGREVNESG